MPASTSSAASARRGRGATIARRTRAARTPNARSRSIRAMRRRSTALRAARISSCSISWTRRGAICVVQAPRHGDRRGTFALRSPVRPNPIAMSVVRLVRIDGTTLTVVGLDCLDGTPLIDIKPYFASVDSVPEAVVGWNKKRSRERERGAGLSGGQRLRACAPPRVNAHADPRKTSAARPAPGPQAAARARRSPAAESRTARGASRDNARHARRNNPARSRA